MYKPDYDFAIDLPQGEEAESTIAFLLHMQNGDLIEVKRDMWVSKTGNVAIEYEYKGKPSGIAATRALWWAILLNGDAYAGEVFVILKTERLKQIARRYFGSERDKACGDNMQARAIMLPVTDLLET
jgi:hypothetical protein